VRDAINAGLLSRERFENYLKLKKEAKYDGLNSRQIEHEKIKEIFKESGGIKSARKMMKETRKMMKEKNKSRHEF
jgi:ribosome biogenesis GTPase